MGKKFTCKSEAQKKAIAASYAKKRAAEKDEKMAETHREKFPERFPFWARLKFGKHRPTLVIDEDLAKNKQKQRMEAGFVHREVIHTKKDDYEEISPNPNPNDPMPMYLKRPTKTPQRLFDPFNGDWAIPDDLKQRYDKNNHKKDDEEEK